MPLRSSATMKQCNYEAVPLRSSVTLKQCNYGAMQLWRNATMKQCTVQQCNFATLLLCHLQTKQLCNSATSQQCNLTTCNYADVIGHKVRFSLISRIWDLAPNPTQPDKKGRFLGSETLTFRARLEPGIPNSENLTRLPKDHSVQSYYFKASWHQ